MTQSGPCPSGPRLGPRGAKGHAAELLPPKTRRTRRPGGLLVEIQHEPRNTKRRSLADAILRARMLCSEQQYQEALQILDSCMNQVGKHPQLLESIEEIRREAREYADAKSAAAASSSASSDAWRDRSAIVAKALALSKRHESEGKTAEAIHVLELALSRYPEASDLATEKRRLQRPPVRSAPPPSDCPRPIRIPRLCSCSQFRSRRRRLCRYHRPQLPYRRLPRAGESEWSAELWQRRRSVE